MRIDEGLLRGSERAEFELRRLYGGRGYRRYKMNKFEEYDLYAANKDFLSSEGVITFTDTNGRLMALKPDVTLSIVKNYREGGVAKVYYNENVYRISPGTGAYREIMQTGLECMGDIGLYDVCEVLMLAADSLSVIGPDSVLDISHTGVVAGLLDELCVPDEAKARLAECVAGKNGHELERICRLYGADEAAAQRAALLVSEYGDWERVLGRIRPACGGAASRAFAELERICAVLAECGYGGRISVDFSHVGDLNYYSGVTFAGFVRGVPRCVLSGGQYDRLMQRMGKQAGGIGFAVYLDQLERLELARRDCDADALLIYGAEDSAADVAKAVRALSQGGKSVMAMQSVPDGMTFARIIRMGGEGAL